MTATKLYSKEELIEEMKRIFALGWHPSTKKTVDVRNDGAVGNTLERLLGIEENNLPIPNANEWELKGQRAHTSSMVTLKHMEPSPTAARIVPRILLPLYGWAHKQAGLKYGAKEMSFRSTTCAPKCTNRGFQIIVDREQQKLRFVFDSTKADVTDIEITTWLKSVEQRIGLNPLNPEPYWGFDDLRNKIGAKIGNCFYVIADSKMEDGHEYFNFKHLDILSGFSFDNFLKAIENGHVQIDFDARTGHNHGTKFRVKQGAWEHLYSSVKRAI